MFKLTTAILISMAMASPVLAQDNTKDYVKDAQQMYATYTNTISVLEENGATRDQIDRLTVGDMINIYMILGSEDMDANGKEYQIRSIFQARGMPS